MIGLTRLNGRLLVVNAELIETVESTPDTVVSLISGKKLMVLESPDEIIERVMHYRQKTGSAGSLPPAYNDPTAADLASQHED